MATGRNEPCPCGSGRKYKACHGAQDATARTSPVTLIVVGVALLVGLLIAGRALFGASSGPDGPAPDGKVWSEEHGHWH